MKEKTAADAVETAEKATKKAAKKAARKAPRKAAKKAVRRAAKKATRKAAPKAVPKAPPKMVEGPQTKPVVEPKPVKDAAAKLKLEVYRLAQDAPDQRYFILANGKPVRHVAHLAEVLDDLEDHVFDHHVSPERNDFHNWVRDVFKDIELAKKMLGVNRKEDLQLVIYKHVAHKAWR